MRKLAYCLVLVSCCMFGFAGCAKDAATPTTDTTAPMTNDDSGAADDMATPEAGGDKAAADTPADGGDTKTADAPTDK